MGLVDPLVAVAIAITFLVVLLYRRVNLGIALNAAALLLALFTLDWISIPLVIWETTIALPTITVVIATFSIMVLSQLYQETGVINRLSTSVAKLIRNPKIVLSVLPAVIGLLPVGGGALMSAPLVDREAEKLELDPSKKAYVNVWFRHVIFPVYPITPVLVTAALLTGVSIPMIVIREIPVALAMLLVGYLISFWGVSKTKKVQETVKEDVYSPKREFLVSFSPILITIIIAMLLSLTGADKLLFGFEIALASLVGLGVLLMLSKPDSKTAFRPLCSWGTYGIAFAAYGAFLLRNVIVEAGIGEVFSSLIGGGGVDIVLFLVLVPAVLGFLSGSPSGGIATSVSVLSGLLMLPFAPKVAALVYISAYFGYLISPTHLCLMFTVDYFKCPLAKTYRYMVPSFLTTFPVALLVYFLI